MCFIYVYMREGNIYSVWLQTHFWIKEVRVCVHKAVPWIELQLKVGNKCDSSGTAVPKEKEAEINFVLCCTQSNEIKTKGDHKVLYSIVLTMLVGILLTALLDLSV